MCFPVYSLNTHVTDLAAFFRGVRGDNVPGSSSSLSRPVPSELLSTFICKNMEPIFWSPLFRGSPDDTKTAMAGRGNPGLAGLQLYFGLVFRIFLPLQKMLDDRGYHSFPTTSGWVNMSINRTSVTLFIPRENVMGLETSNWRLVTSLINLYPTHHRHPWR